MQGPAEVGLAEVARCARAAIHDQGADGGGREVVVRVVGRVVGVAEGDPVIGDVVLAILEATDGDLIVVADAGAVAAYARDAGGDQGDVGIVADFRNVLLDVLAADDRFRLHLVQRRLGRRVLGCAVDLGLDDDFGHVSAFRPGAGHGRRGRDRRIGGGFGGVGRPGGRNHQEHTRARQQAGEVLARHD